MTWTEDLLTSGAQHFRTDAGQNRGGGLRTGPWAEGIRRFQQTTCQAEEEKESSKNLDQKTLLLIDYECMAEHECSILGKLYKWQLDDIAKRDKNTK